ncbi:PREDICTED: macrophage mannose receptor 1-like [Cyprinodon variegatus]|uniref:macrophage mannose receptor 1-like n=1 Tax=Cyprinodon variegatus TaxID=28743 RepID=UPI000742848B|nr:PREDICTED: macrophage mannose receptor 1-like [Cyprinodon variegatus]
MSDSNFYQHEEKEFRKWATGEPNNKWGKESCGVMTSTGVWQDVPCTETLEPICFNVTGTNVTFVRINTGMQWPAAQSYCREHHSDLASVRNELENHKIHQLVPAGAKVWIGLYRDTWKWVDGTNSSFRFWSGNEPNNNYHNEDCAVANFGNGGKWEDWSCAHKKAFICYTAFHTKQVIKLKLAFSSSVDQNKSAEDLLRKLKQKMQDSGVKGDIKLSWRKQPDGQIFIKEKNNGD